MPYVPSANSTKIDQFIDKVAKQLESVERYFIMLAALVYAADEVGFFVPENWGKDGDKTPARERYFALVSMAREKAQDVARELDASFRLLTERGVLFASVFEKGDANAKVDEALDEALFVLGGAGTQPLVLLFDEDEIKRLGEKPLARLVTLQERAIELFKPQTVEAAGAASEALAEALELAKLLAEGEDDRDWSDDDQEPEAGEDENDKKSEDGQEEKDGQEGQEGGDQDGQDPEDTTSESDGELDQCKQLEVVNLGKAGVTLGDLLDHAISGVEGLEGTVYEGSGLAQFKTTDGRWWCVLYEVHLRQLARPTCDECNAEIDPAEVGQEGPERVLCRRCSATST